MNPIDILTSEHRVIESVLESLETYVDRLGVPDTGADPADLGRYTDFLSAFADACHHAKEEDILFEAMREDGMPRSSGPIGVMIQEHDEGRLLVRTLSAFADRAVQPGWSGGDIEGIRQTAHACAELLRHHIQKEDAILFPLAAARLRPESMAEVARRFDAFEKLDAGAGEHERLRALAGELIAR